MIDINPQRTASLLQELIEIWTESVLATHVFLNIKDTETLTPVVQLGLSRIEELLVIYQDRKAVGFMGIETHKIEMLFLHPDVRGQGLGKQLVQMAFDKYNVQYVDVNEQNERAILFYKARGFIVFERSECDEQGNSFPILKMRKNTASAKELV